MKLSSIALAVAVALGLSTNVARAEQPQATAAATELVPKDIGEGDMNRYIVKSNGVVGLLNASLRGVESWNRYLSWVNVQRGPTGKERIIYGLYSVGSSANDAIAKARASADAEPSIPALDAATKELAATFEKLLPILNEAEAYYDRKDYLTDGMKGGKALHEKLVPAAHAFIAARERTEALQNQFKSSLDLQQLAQVEKKEGKSRNWHLRYTMIQLKRAVDLMPRDPRKPGDLKAFDAALASFGDATRDFDNVVRESGKSSSVDSYPRDILGNLRELRAEYAKRRPDPMTVSMSSQGIITRYNMMVTMSNVFR